VTCVSCADSNKQACIDDVYQSLTEQKRFYYKVDYNISKPAEKSILNLNGLVSLNRNSDSGISAAYFGLNQALPSNYLHSLYLSPNWIHEMSSNLFDIESADILFDSLHSPILLNPDILYDLKEETHRITKVKNENGLFKLVFDLEKEEDRLIVVWDNELDKLIEVEYQYNVKSTDFYSRTWSFSYLTEADHKKISEEYKIQNQIANQAFL